MGAWGRKEKKEKGGAAGGEQSDCRSFIIHLMISSFIPIFPFMVHKENCKLQPSGEVLPNRDYPHYLHPKKKKKKKKKEGNGGWGKGKRGGGGWQRQL